MPPFFPPRPKRESIRTAICCEQPSDSNPFIAAQTLWHGFDAAKLPDKYGWTEILFLLCRGELPAADENHRLNRLMAFLANPGPRDTAVRAAMNCGIGKTPITTILTTGLTVRGGMAEGAMHVEAAMRLLAGQLPPNPDRDIDADDYAHCLIHDYQHFWQQHREDEIVPLPETPPGFGLYYGERDPRAGQLLALLDDGQGAYTRLALALEAELATEQETYLTLSGVAAAVLCDLGFSPEQGAGIYLIAGSAGILAHGVEQLSHSWNEYPFWADPSYYHYEGPEPNRKMSKP